VTVLAVRSDGGYSQLLTTEYSQVGTREYATCSNRGACDYNTGKCDCFDGFISSDGRGGDGSRGDCGYRYYNGKFSYFQVPNITVETSCPYHQNAICSGHGSCNETSGVCSCYSGYGGANCANRTCETAHTWFGGSIGAGHSSISVCGGVGYCNGETGNCTDCGGNWGTYQGTMCESLSCFKDSTGNVCSGNGTCLTLREMAHLTYNEQKELSGVVYETPWDADMIRGCACTRAISVDNQYDETYVYHISNFFSTHYLNYSFGTGTESWRTQFYRGPNAYSATDYTGYHCQHALCPKGDDPLTGGQFNEIQTLRCRANNGTFQLTFRENTTLPIAYNATKAEIKIALEQLFTIQSVVVIGRQNDSVCSSSGDTVTYVEFLSEFGDLPLLKVDTSLLSYYTSGSAHNYVEFNITEYQKGTKEDIECSYRGICSEDTGICNCLQGFRSSNGSVTTVGSRGDCTYANPFG
jgi:hypothetical protein